MSRTRAPPRLAARIPRGRTPDCPCILGLRGLCRGRYVQIHQGRRSTSPADLQKHESPRRSAGLGKRAKRACASANRVHSPRPGDNQEHRGSLFLWVESGSARRLCAPRSTASRRRVPAPFHPAPGSRSGCRRPVSTAPRVLVGPRARAGHSAVAWPPPPPAITECRDAGPGAQKTGGGGLTAAPEGLDGSRPRARSRP